MGTAVHRRGTTAPAMHAGSLYYRYAPLNYRCILGSVHPRPSDIRSERSVESQQLQPRYPPDTHRACHSAGPQITCGSFRASQGRGHGVLHVDRLVGIIRSRGSMHRPYLPQTSIGLRILRTRRRTLQHRSVLAVAVPRWEQIRGDVARKTPAHRQRTMSVLGGVDRARASAVSNHLARTPRSSCQFDQRSVNDPYIGHEYMMLKTPDQRMRFRTAICNTNYCHKRRMSTTLGRYWSKFFSQQVCTKHVGRSRQGLGGPDPRIPMQLAPRLAVRGLHAAGEGDVLYAGFVVERRLIENGCYPFLLEKSD
jgi:hypothetical protein